MASFDVVNYSLRPSKNIQRQIVFDGIRILKSKLELADMVYIGLGSIWFTDFVMAHKSLDIRDMVSMESDDIGYSRADFNKPYATVRVRHGHSSQVLAELYEDENFHTRPWVVWLDYDSHLDEVLRDDIRSVIEKSPENTVFLVTFNGRDNLYGHANERTSRLRDLFGAVVPDELPKERCKGDQMQDTLADLTIDFMKSIVAESTRQGGFAPAFRTIYEDTTPMVTVGGFMPSIEKSGMAKCVIDDKTLKCRPEGHIVAPLLTIREAAILQSLLPTTDGLSRDIVRSIGFDLEDDQIETFEKYYREYPIFAQIVA